MPESKPANSNSSDPSLPDSVRTWITLLLIVHLFALAAIALAHTGQSELTERIRRRVPLLQPYMRRVWMDNRYTYADYVNPHPDARLDSQFFIEVDEELADGTTQKLTLPGASMWPETRRRRYLTLARNLAAVVGSDMEAPFAQMVSSGLLAEQPDAISLRLTCLERFTPTASGDPPEDSSAVLGDDGVYSATIYACQAWINEDDRSTEIRKQEEPRRLAPVVPTPTTAQ